MPPHQRKGKHDNTIADDDRVDYANESLRFSELGDEARSLSGGGSDHPHGFVDNELALPRTQVPIEEHIIAVKTKDDHNITKDYEIITSPKSRLLELDDDPTMTMSSMSDESWEHVENESEGGRMERKAYAEVVKERPTGGGMAEMPGDGARQEKSM